MPSSAEDAYPALQVVPDVGPRASTLEAVHRDDGAVWVVELCGEADISTRPTLEGALSRGLSMGRGAVVVDVSNLDFCDASCVRTVLNANVTGCLVLEGADGIVGRAFEILDPHRSIARYRAPRLPFPR